MSKKNIIIIGTILVFVIGVSSFVTFKWINKNDSSINQKTQSYEVDLGKEEIEIITKISNNGKFLQSMFPFITNSDINTTYLYNTSESRINHIRSVLFLGQDFLDISEKEVHLESINELEFTVSFSAFDKLSQEFFGKNIIETELKNFSVKDGQIFEIREPQGFGIILPVFWKIIYNPQNEMYSLYIADMYSPVIKGTKENEEEIFQSYGPNASKKRITNAELEKNKPEITIVNYKKENEKNILVSAKLVTYENALKNE